MAKINTLKLDIQPTDDSAIHKVTVSFRLTYNAPEYGKKFRYRIKLTGTDIGEPSTPHPFPLYEFKFGSSSTKSVTGVGPVTTLTKVTRNVPREFLDEDRDMTFEDPTHTGAKAHLVFPDDIVATVTLERPAGAFVILADTKRSSVKTFTA